MAREINLTADDLKSLEEELAGAELYEEQRSFLEILVKRARSGAERSQSLAAAPGWLWTWTYRF